MSGPFLVVGWSKGRIVAAWFSLTRRAAEKRQAWWESGPQRGASLEARVYDLTKLLSLYAVLERCEIEELERMNADEPETVVQQ